MNLAIALQPCYHSRAYRLSLQAVNLAFALQPYYASRAYRLSLQAVGHELGTCAEWFKETK